MLLPQTGTRTSLEEAKTLINFSHKNTWEKEYPDHRRNDARYQVKREVILRLHTVHNRLRCHLYNKVKIGLTDECACGTNKVAADNILQACPI